jgi:glycosyltransferase involved in cell wall biosynthesis
MRKLIIQIPCFNEEQTLAFTLAALPRQVAGIDRVEWLVIDDGSTDRTSAVARECGVDHVVRFTRNQGLAKAFVAGLDTAIKAGADIIVNTDGDNQYYADDIPTLIEPILAGRADVVVGARPIAMIESFSPLKKLLHRAGSWAVRRVSNTTIPDAPSGFRALSRHAAMRLNVFNEYTYTLETIIQAGVKNMAMVSVPVRVNKQTRPSRLIRSIPRYIRASIITILRISMTYRPLRFFALPGLASFAFGLLLGLRFMYAYFTTGGAGHVQSLILAALLLGSGFFLMVVGLLADLIAVNRKLLEDIKYRVRRLESAHGDRVSSGAVMEGAFTAPRLRRVPRRAQAAGITRRTVS